MDPATLHPGRVFAPGCRRRQVLARLVALPAALGLALLGDRLGHDDAARGKKRKRRHKQRKRRSGASSAAAYVPEPEELAFLTLLNAYRAEHGARRLSLNAQLGAAAEHHSQDMASHNTVSHELSDGTSPLRNIERFGYRNFIWWGEVIAAGTAFETAERAIAALKTSPSHDAMMRKGQFEHCGIGRAHNPNADHVWYWTVTFGAK